MLEFDPLEHFYRYIRLWWLILAAALLGGLAGFIFSRSHPPVYEAVATFMVTVDQDMVLQKPLDMYDKDLALASTHGALVSRPVTDYVIGEAARLGQDTDQWNLIANTSIERRHAFWELHFRSPDPDFAQTLVNLWAERGYQAMLQLQADGKVPAYVIYSPPSQAFRPVQPIYFGANKLILAGSLLGWLTGLLLSELAGDKILKRSRG